jgi:HK97 family phage portal protein
LLISNGAFAPTTFGDETPSFGGQQYYYARSGLSLSDSFASYGAVYRSQVWINTLVNKIAYGAARLPLKVYERGPDDSRNDARDSPFAKLLRNPNPRHDRFFFWLWTASTFEVYGEALWVKVRPSAGAAPTQLWPMHPANVTTRRDEQGNLIYRYLYGPQGEKALEWTSDDVVHFRSYNPDDQVRGLSRLEALRQTILNEDAARRASAAMWKNGGRPSMALTHPKTLSDGAAARLSASVNALHSGVDNWGKIAILEEGLTPTLFPLNAEEMQYIESRHISREEACGVFDVPPPVVHILDRATFSNITEQMRSMYRDTMAPRLGLYESVLDNQLRPDFDPQGNQYAEFLMDEVLRGAFEQRAEAYSKADYMTIAEKRKSENLPFIEGTDRVFLNSAIQPLDAIDRAAAALPTPSEHVPVLAQKDAVLDAEVLCDMCGKPEIKTSPRGLCRSCEGKVSRMLTSRKEISA